MAVHPWFVPVQGQRIDDLDDPIRPLWIRAAAEVARMNTFFPLMPLLGTRWAKQRPFQGMRVAINAHLTTLTAALMRELTLGKTIS